jgi:hypothetical protein
MITLSQLDPSAEIACTLPIYEARGHMDVLQELVGGHLDDLSRDGDRLHIRIRRAGRAGLEADVAAFAEAEKACCAFLGFALESEPEAVTLDIVAPAGAAMTLEDIEWMVSAAGRQGAV